MKLNRVRERLLPLSPAVQSGEREYTTNDFESMSRNVLGKGAFAQVWPVRNKETKERYAVKLIKKATINKSGILSAIKRETQVMYQLKDENIIRLHDHFEDDHKVYLLLEYASKGTLYDLISREGKLTPLNAAKYLRELIAALRCL